jgi:hypothetical protein
VPARRGMRPRRNFQWAERFYRRRSEAVRGAIRDITAKQDNETQRGWSSFADTRQITFSNTIGEDHRIRHFLAAVCRRRWPSGRRPQASQQLSDFRNAHRRAIFIGESRDAIRRRLALVELGNQPASAPRTRTSATHSFAKLI